MKEIWWLLAIVGLCFVLPLIGCGIADLIEHKNQRRRAAMRVWLGARPTRATRDEALLKVDEAWADTRITQDEHEEYMATIEEARTNETIEEIVKRVVVVEKPK